MEALSGVSAVIAVVDLGFSLAAALNTYVTQVSTAGDDVSNLSSEIEATLAHLRGLGNLIKKNEETKAWDNDGLELAKLSIKDCEKIIIKLRRLLQKANWKRGDDDLGGFEKNEIDLGKFERATWPRLKPDLEACKVELHRIKLNIVFVTSAYMLGTVTSKAERDKHRERIRDLSEARKWNSEKMKKLRERQKSPLPVYVSGRRGPRLASHVNSGYSSYVDEALEEELQEDFERFLAAEQEKEEEENRLLFLAEEARKRAVEEEQRKAIEEKAVEAHLQKIRKAELEMKVKRDELRKKLQERGGLTVQQIDMVIDNALPATSGLASLIARDIEASEKDTTQAIVAPRNVTGSKDTSQLARPVEKVSILRKMFPSRNTATSSASSQSLVSAWRDPATKTGFAKLESWYISRETRWDQELQQWNASRHVPAPLPQTWMINALMEAENGGSKPSKAFKPVWEVLQSLSPQLVYSINDLLEQRALRKPNHEWSILHISPANQFENNRTSVKIGPFRFHVDDGVQNINDIYIILKFEEISGGAIGREPEREDGLSRRGRNRSRSRSPVSTISECSVKIRLPETSVVPAPRVSIGRRSKSIARRVSNYNGDEENYGSPGPIFPSRRRTYSGGPPQTSVSFMDDARKQQYPDLTAPRERERELERHEYSLREQAERRRRELELERERERDLGPREYSLHERAERRRRELYLEREREREWERRILERQRDRLTEPAPVIIEERSYDHTRNRARRDSYNAYENPSTQNWTVVNDHPAPTSRHLPIEVEAVPRMYQPIYPSPYGPSYNLGAYPMPPPAPAHNPYAPSPASAPTRNHERSYGLHSRDAHAHHNMSLVSFRQAQPLRAPSMPPLQSSFDDYDLDNSYIPNRPTPVYVQDADEYGEPIAGTRRSATARRRSSSQRRRSINRGDSYGPERVEIYNTADDDVDIRIRRLERQDSVDTPPRRRSSYPYPKANDTFAGDENDAEKDILDRLTAKLTRNPTTDLKVSEDGLSTEDAPDQLPNHVNSAHNPTRLSDILEDSDEDKSRNELKDDEHDGWDAEHFELGDERHRRITRSPESFDDEDSRNPRDGPYML